MAPPLEGSRLILHPRYAQGSHPLARAGWRVLGTSRRQNDVLRDEGEAYARRLIQAGVPTTSVRYNAIIHDFMMLNPVRATRAATAAIDQAIHALRKALGTDPDAQRRR
jgi:acetyl esterase/lipase